MQPAIFTGRRVTYLHWVKHRLDKEATPSQPHSTLLTGRLTQLLATCLFVYFLFVTYFPIIKVKGNIGEGLKRHRVPSYPEVTTLTLGHKSFQLCIYACLLYIAWCSASHTTLVYEVLFYLGRWNTHLVYSSDHEVPEFKHKARTCKSWFLFFFFYCNSSSIFSFRKITPMTS